MNARTRAARRERKQDPPSSAGDLRAVCASWQHGLWSVLQRQDIAYQAVDTVRTSQVLAFRLRLNDERQLSKALGLSEQLAYKMHVESVRVARNRGFVDVEIALPKVFHRPLPIKALQRKGNTWITLGQTAVGTPVRANLAGNRTSQILVTGTTGSGKTFTERLIAWTLSTDNAPDQVALLLIDGAKRGAAWYGFEREAHLAHPIITEANEAIAALSWAVAELDRRMEHNRKEPRLVVIVDEVRALLNVAGEDVAKAVEYIASIGREFGVHLVVATQHPLTDALGGSIAKANLTMRLVGRVADANAAYLATGVKASGAERLMGNGDFLFVCAGQVHRFQGAVVGNRELGRLPRAEATPHLDLGTGNLDRVMDVVEPAASRRKDLDTEPEAVAYALATGCGADVLRRHYRPMGQTRAQRICKFARTLRRLFPKLGYIAPLALDQLSEETRHRARTVGLIGERT